jgi:dTDP-4-amino-4,6-dideoxygalactose transaminase
LERELNVLFPGAGVIAFDAGRAALAAALRIAMRMTGRDQVVLPAYTSYSVAAAAAASGSKVVLCDLDPRTLQLDRAALRSAVGPRTAALLLGNLYGFPDVTSDLDWVRASGAMIIDDAAQALGAREQGRAVGTRGPLGILSFGRGKCVSLGDGGVLLVNDPACAVEADRERPVAGARGAGLLVMAAGTTVSASPLAFGMLSRLPGLRVGESWYDPEFEAHAMPAAARGLAAGLAGITGEFRLMRQRVARTWTEALKGVRGLVLPQPPDGSEAAWLRVPALAADQADREAKVSLLAQAGLSFVRSFPTSLGAIQGFRGQLASDLPTPGADSIAARMIALPCHGSISPSLIRRAAAALENSGPGPASPVLATTRGTHG